MNVKLSPVWKGAHLFMQHVVKVGVHGCVSSVINLLGFLVQFGCSTTSSSVPQLHQSVRGGSSWSHTDSARRGCCIAGAEESQHSVSTPIFVSGTQIGPLSIDVCIATQAVCYSGRGARMERQLIGAL